MSQQMDDMLKIRKTLTEVSSPCVIGIKMVSLLVIGIKMVSRKKKIAAYIRDLTGIVPDNGEGATKSK